MRGAASDFYYQSVRLVPANLVWGVGFLALFALAAGRGSLVALVLLPLLAIPWVGVVRLAALIVRKDDVVLSDVFEAYRTYLRPTLGVGIATVLATTVFATNVALGLTSGAALGWAFATLAAWGLVLTWLFSLCFWPLLVDPRRGHLGVMRKARLAAFLIVAFPGRLGLLGLVLGIILVVSTIAIAAILSISVAYGALVACRVVLPAADRLEARLALTGDRTAIS